MMRLDCAWGVEQLVGGLEHFLVFHILGIVTPTDELHHFSEWWRNTTNIHQPDNIN